MYRKKEIFKQGDIIVCIDISGKSFKGKKKPDLKTVTKNQSYIVQKKDNPYNDAVFIINDLGEKKSYATRRFVKTMGPKIKKLIRNIKNDNI